MTVTTDRVQLGVRIEKNLVKVLKGLAEFNDEREPGRDCSTRVVLHSFEPVPGDEGESCASPHSRRQLEVVETLRSMYAVSRDPHVPPDVRPRRGRRHAPGASVRSPHSS